MAKLAICKEGPARGGGSARMARICRIVVPRPKDSHGPGRHDGSGLAGTSLAGTLGPEEPGLWPTAIPNQRPEGMMGGNGCLLGCGSMCPVQGVSSLKPVMLPLQELRGKGQQDGRRKCCSIRCSIAQQIQLGDAMPRDGP
jgi:hypothetical protein